MKWKLIKVSGNQPVQHMDKNGTVMLVTAPNVLHLMAQGVTRRTLVMYRGEKRFVAYEGMEDRTDRLSQEQWSNIHAQVIAATTLLGRMPDNFVQEIDL